MRIFAIVLLLTLIILILIYKPNKNAPMASQEFSNAERAEFLTSDGVKIVGDYYPVSIANAPAVLLLHMMPSDRKSWQPFAKKLEAGGFKVLAIDLRGHGESVVQEINGSKRSLNYKDFSDEDHQKSILDIKAAVDFLKQKSYSKLFLGGASIGANLALQYLAENPEAEKAFLLSSGLNYRGIETLPFARQLQSNQAVLVAAAKDDNRSGGPADSTAEEIYNSLAGKKEIKIFDKGGHGTDILNAHPEFMDELINWLKI